MNLLSIVTGGTVINFLIGGSLPIMSIFLTMVELGLTTGYFIASHTWVSSINLYGLSTKFITLSAIIRAAAVDNISPTVGITLPIKVALIWLASLIVYEAGSILENAHEFGLKITWPQKWRGVFERDVGKYPDKDGQENDIPCIEGNFN